MNSLALFAVALGVASGQSSVGSLASGFGPGYADYRIPVAQPPIKNAPFMAELNTKPSGLSDPQSPRRILRDTQGCTRVEHALVEINDPARGVLWVLDSGKKIAHRARYQTAGVLPGGITVTGKLITPSTNAPAPARPETREEFLGTQTIQGVLAEGRRFSTSASASATEEWRSPALQLVLRSVTRDPRGPERTLEVVKLTRTPPDPALFDIPLDYRVVDEPSQFRVEFPKPAPTTAK